MCLATVLLPKKSMNGVCIEQGVTIPLLRLLPTPPDLGMNGMESEVTGEMGRTWKISCTSGMHVEADVCPTVSEGNPTAPTVPPAQAKSCLLKNNMRI